MAIPDFQTIMLPLVKLAADGKDHSIHEAVEKLAIEFNLTDEDKVKLIPSGLQPVFYNRVGWARTHLKKARLLEDPQRGYFCITERGKKVLSQNPERIDTNFLSQFPEYVVFKRTTRETVETPEVAEDIEDLTPEEALEEAYQKIHEGLADEVLTAVMNSSPGFFEKLVIELLVRMGYGGSRRDAARAVGGSGDEGIDGIIDEDRLGLDTIYIQAKKWKEDNSVGRPEIQKFVGALQGQQAKKGIFITTTKFTEDARNYASKIDTKVVLIDGKRLANLMIDYNVGVTPQANYETKSLDSDYFGEATRLE